MSLTTASTKIEVAAATMAELVAFYTATAGKSIKKFETRAKGVERCTALLVAEPNPLAKAAEVLAAGKVTLTEPKSPARRLKLNLSATGPILKSTPAAKKSAKAAPKPATSGGIKGRAHFSVDGVITIVHKGENPKRAAAAERYDLYRSGMTVAAYIAAGGQRRDVVWDQRQGWISVKG